MRQGRRLRRRRLRGEGSGDVVVMVVVGRVSFFEIPIS